MEIKELNWASENGKWYIRFVTDFCGYIEGRNVDVVFNIQDNEVVKGVLLPGSVVPIGKRGYKVIKKSNVQIPKYIDEKIISLNKLIITGKYKDCSYFEVDYNSINNKSKREVRYSVMKETLETKKFARFIINTRR